MTITLAHLFYITMKENSRERERRKNIENSDENISSRILESEWSERKENSRKEKEKNYWGQWWEICPHEF